MDEFWFTLTAAFAVFMICSNFILYFVESLWSDSESSHFDMTDNAKQLKSVDATGADHEYHEISDEENQDSPLRFDKPLNFDFGPSLLDEMDQMFKSLGWCS